MQPFTKQPVEFYKSSFTVTAYNIGTSKWKETVNNLQTNAVSLDFFNNHFVVLLCSVQPYKSFIPKLQSFFLSRFVFKVRVFELYVQKNEDMILKKGHKGKSF